MDNVITMIVKQFGEDILLDKQKFTAKNECGFTAGNKRWII